MGRYIRGAIEQVQVVTVPFVTKDAASLALDGTVNERTLVSSIEATWVLSGVTPTAGVGPMVVGVAHSDYTASEIEDYLDLDTTWDEGDKISQEIGRRKIRRVGSFEAADDLVDSISLNDGKAIKTKLNWILLQGQTLSTWCYNGGLVSFVTTTPTLVVNGHANLWPR